MKVPEPTHSSPCEKCNQDHKTHLCNWPEVEEQCPICGGDLYVFGGVEECDTCGYHSVL